MHEGETLKKFSKEALEEKIKEALALKKLPNPKYDFLGRMRTLRASYRAGQVTEGEVKRELESIHSEFEQYKCRIGDEYGQLMESIGDHPDD